MKHLKNINLLLLSALLTTACSNEETPEPTINPANDPEAVELGITAGVALTKSAISGWSTNDQIAIFATGDDYTSAKKNDHAIYTYNTNWSNSGNDKIYLTHKTATIYGYYPSSLTKPSSTTDPVVAINVFEGGDDDDNAKYPALASLDNADKVWSTSWVTNADASKLITAPGEVDYMWAEDANNASSQATASNGKEDSNVDESVSLNMKHALSMVSFRIYNDGTYTGSSKLTKIVLKNSSTTVLSKGNNPTMSLKNGAITENTSTAATYTRTFTDTDGYAIPTKGENKATTEDNAKEAAKKFSIMVLPDGNSKFDKTKVQVEFTIDGATYPIALADPTESGDEGKWIAGKNYLYTVKLSGKELTITSVSVAQWTSATGSDLNVK